MAFLEGDLLKDFQAIDKLISPTTITLPHLEEV
jgi:hypothetical protein